MRPVIMSAVVALSLSLSISAQTMSWQLATSSSQNCKDCYNQSLVANRGNIQKVMNVFVDNVYQNSDVEIMAQFISYFNNPSATDFRHEVASRFIRLADADSMTRLQIEILSLYSHSDLGNSTKTAIAYVAPTIPNYTQSSELNKMIAKTYTLLPRDAKENQKNYDKRVREYASSTYLIYVKHVAQNGGSLPSTETAFATKLAKQYN